MSTTGLGACFPNADNFSVDTGGTGDSITAEWTPDGSGGGLLSVEIPSGCTEGATIVDYSILLGLSRSFCGQKYQFAISGTGSSAASSSPDITIYDGNDNLLLEMQASGSTVCDTSPSDLTLVSGSNPATGHVPSCGGTEGLFSIFITGTNTDSCAYSFTVTVTAFPP